MIAAYDIERVAVACEQMLVAIDAAEKHKLADWLSHRLTVVRSECRGLKDAIQEHGDKIEAGGEE